MSMQMARAVLECSDTGPFLAEALRLLDHWAMDPSARSPKLNLERLLSAWASRLDRQTRQRVWDALVGEIKEKKGRPYLEYLGEMRSRLLPEEAQ